MIDQEQAIRQFLKNLLQQIGISVPLQKQSVLFDAVVGFIDRFVSDIVMSAQQAIAERDAEIDRLKAKVAELQSNQQTTSQPTTAKQVPATHYDTDIETDHTQYVEDESNGNQSGGWSRRFRGK